MKTLRNFLIVSMVSLASSLAFAASVTQVKNRRARLDLTGLTGVKVGDTLFAVDASGKRKGILIVRQVKGNRAVADIQKGSASVGMDLQARRGSTSRTMSRPVRNEDLDVGSSARAQRLQERMKVGPAWGLLANIHQPKMDVQFSVGQGAARRTATTSLKGMSFGVGGFYDYLLSDRLQIRAIAGLDQVTASGSTALPDCGGQTTKDCKFNVMYLTLAGQGRYILNDGNTRFWIGGGASFLLAMSKSSNVLDTSQISTNQTYFASFGADIGLDRSTFIPVSLDYGMFPSSETVKANMMTLRAGYGWFF